ncbi:MAG: tetratricopeptide repeat protein [Candidatus Omnitrophica bacterium]|nr:tetratricopeptide repeat protein [Candidatus Omnitrophota bacterium]
MRLDLKKILKFIVIGATLVYFLSKLIYPIHNPDIWTDLKTGQYILKQNTIPREDIYSYTAEGVSWVNHHWLFQVFAYSFYRFLGIEGVIFLKIIVFLSAYWLLYLLVFDKNNYALLAVLLFLTLQAQEGQLLARARMFTQLFIAVYLFILHRYKYAQGHKKWPVFSLIFFQLLWANMHSGSYMGIFIASCFILGEFIDRKRAYSESLSPMPGIKMKRIIAVGIVLILCSGITPFGYKIALYPFERMYALRTMGIDELLSPLRGDIFLSRMPYYKILLVVTFFSMVFNIKRMPSFYIMLVFGLLALSLFTRRGIPLFSLVAFAVNAINIKAIFAHICLPVWKTALRAGWSRRIKPQLLSAILQIAIVFLLSHQVALAAIGLGPGEIIFKGAADFIVEAKPEGNMFNTYGMGSYFIWRLYPQWKVMVDGRNVHSSESYRFYLESLKGEGKFKKLAAEYKINFVALDYIFLTKTHSLIKELYNNKDWKLVYFDDKAVIFIKNIEKNRGIIRQYAIDFEDDTPREIVLKEERENTWLNIANPANRLVNMANLFRILDLPQQRIYYLRSALAIDADCVEAYRMLGLAYLEQGGLKQAKENLEKAIELSPGDREAHSSLGYIYGVMGEPERAIEHLCLALRLSPPDPQTIYNLGIAYTDRELYREAEKSFKKVLKLSPDYKKTHFLLGAVLVYRGALQEARLELEKALAQENSEPQIEKIQKLLAVISSRSREKPVP